MKYQEVTSFFQRKFGFLLFLKIVNSENARFGAIYSLTYSHFPQAFPQAGSVLFLSEIGIAPGFRVIRNFPEDNRILSCILFCILMHFNIFYK